MNWNQRGFAGADFLLIAFGIPFVIAAIFGYAFYDTREALRDDEIEITIAEPESLMANTHACQVQMCSGGHRNQVRMEE